MEIGGEELEMRGGSGARSGELTIKYSTELSEAPYTIDINHREMKRVLKDFGISPKKTGKIEIDVLRYQPIDPMDINSGKDKIFGRYVGNSNKVEIFADTIWNAYEELVDTCSDVIEGSKDPKAIDKFRKDGILITGRLSDYLEKAPPKRARRFVQKLATIGLERRMTQDLLHETGHKALDEKREGARIFLDPLMQKGLPLLFTGTVLASWAAIIRGSAQPEMLLIPMAVSSWLAHDLGQFAAYKYSPEEIAARKFETRFNEYPDLVKIKRK